MEQKLVIFSFNIKIYQCFSFSVFDNKIKNHYKTDLQQCCIYTEPQPHRVKFLINGAKKISSKIEKQHQNWSFLFNTMNYQCFSFAIFDNQIKKHYKTGLCQCYICTKPQLHNKVKFLNWIKKKEESSSKIRKKNENVSLCLRLR